jgi:hypothetical protein
MCTPQLFASCSPLPSKVSYNWVLNSVSLKLKISYNVQVNISHYMGSDLSKKFILSSQRHYTELGMWCCLYLEIRTIFKTFLYIDGGSFSLLLYGSNFYGYSVTYNL